MASGLSLDDPARAPGGLALMTGGVGERERMEVLAEIEVGGAGTVQG